MNSDVNLIAQVRAITVSLHLLRHLNLQQVMDLSTSTPLIPMVPQDIQTIELVGSGYFDEARSAQLTINFDPRTSKKGGFKFAFFGTCSVLLLDTLRCNRICAKACFQQDKGGKDQVCPPSDQVRKLLMELRCLSWAHALMTLVYSFVDSFECPTIEVPTVTFVAAALAIGQNTTKEKGDVLLLEQPIQGSFRKFIHNGSAAILPMPNAEMQNIAEFLSFSQHVQYLKTKKLAFISDFQGKYNHSTSHIISELYTRRWKASNRSSNPD